MIHRMPDTLGCSHLPTRPHDLVQSQPRPLALAEVLKWTSLAVDHHIASPGGWDCSPAGNVSTLCVDHRVESLESVAVPAPSWGWEASPIVHWISSFQWVVLLTSGLLAIHGQVDHRRVYPGRADLHEGGLANVAHASDEALG